MGEIVQVNVSRGGVPKRPIPEGMITAHGLDGDSWAHPQFHGGPDQKILIISADVLDALAAQGFPVFPGALGENLTVRGVDTGYLRAGQNWRAGDAVLELTKVRTPCGTLDVYGKALRAAIYDARVKAGDPESPLWAHSGFYARVIRGGRVAPGAPFVLLSMNC